ncbi:MULTISPECIES: tetratricopeptide repeat protein [unclassified Pseudomonas]|uniref:tetratricopeptide repeat protein n=1 Tax=unclassified Pseudomonas TaxID=196821 RepID=UPI0002DC7DC8|nr:tetratricopeptide repeat protein [Pseudomonas sp. M47T1]
MNKWWFPAVTALALLNGCASVPQGSIPVVDSGTAVSNSERVSGNRGYASVPRQAPQAMSQDSGVVVMPQGESAPMTFAAPQSAPIGTGPITPGPATSGPITPQPYNSAPVTSNYSMPATSNAPTGIPSNNASSGGLAADEQLDGPVLALLTTAQQQQGGGDLNGASSSLERAQRIAPREPQVLYRLAQVRLSQGDAPQAEQLARRALTYANGRPDLQASLWNTIAQAREKQGDSAGASQARQKASGG